MENPDLRARNRLATRAAISAAALRLALDNGPENVRVGEIARLAGVSPRTYNNHFSSREEAICALAADRGESLAAALRARPACESPNEALTAAVIGIYAAPGEPDLAGLRMIASSDALRGAYLQAMAEIEAPLTAAIDERYGVGELAAGVLAAAVMGAAKVATRHWLVLREGRATFEEVLREALRQILP